MLLDASILRGEGCARTRLDASSSKIYILLVGGNDLFRYFSRATKTAQQAIPSNEHYARSFGRTKSIEQAESHSSETSNGDTLDFCRQDAYKNSF